MKQAGDQAQTGKAGESSAFSPFRYPIFRAIWIANLFSNLGSTIQSVAAAWLMTDLTTSKQLIGLVQASVTFPIMLIGVFAGAIADNYDRRRVMLASQVGMLATASALAALTWAQLVTPGLLLAFTFSIGIGTALNSPAWQASVRQQVPKRELPQAIALNSISFNIARSVGPALGGLLISVWDIWLAFAINAVSYFGLIFVLLWWRPEPRRITITPMFVAIGAGVRFCAGNVSLRRLLMRGLVLGGGIAGYQALLPAVVSDRLGGGEFDFGLLLGVFGVGSIIAAPFIGTFRRRFSLESVLALGAGLFIAVMSVLAEVHSVLLAAPAVLLGGMAWVAVLTTLNTAVQMRAPDEILGRCLSIYQAVTFGGMAIGSWLWGLAADLVSLPFALHCASAFLALTLLALHRFAPLPATPEAT